MTRKNYEDEKLTESIVFHIARFHVTHEDDEILFMSFGTHSGLYNDEEKNILYAKSHHIKSKVIQFINQK